MLPFCAKVVRLHTFSVPEDSRLPILVVEDDEPTQKLLQALLRRCGFGSETVRNGAEAILALKTRSYAAVILDIMMPEVGGRDVVAWMESESTGVPVIICSAAGPASLQGFNPDVVKAVIRKPFDVDQFVAAVAGATGT
jgi:two-component system response regulator ResD